MTFRAWTLIPSLTLMLIFGAAPLVADRQSERAAPPSERRLTLHGLKPGEFVVQRLQVPVNIVLIGFDESQVNASDLRGWLPETYKPVVRYPRFYGLNGRDVGLEYTFKYSISAPAWHSLTNSSSISGTIGTPIPATAVPAGLQQSERTISSP